MSANPATASTRGAKKVDPNETIEQKLARVLGGRVTKALAAVERVGDAGVLLQQYGKQKNTDVNPIINQVMKAIADKFTTTQQRLVTGETAKQVFTIEGL